MLIDGHNVKDYSIEHLRDSVGMVYKRILYLVVRLEKIFYGEMNMRVMKILSGHVM